METEPWADPSLILSAAIYAGITVTKIRETGRMVQIFADEKVAKIRRKTFEGMTVKDLSAHLKRRLS